MQLLRFSNLQAVLKLVQLGISMHICRQTYNHCKFVDMQASNQCMQTECITNAILVSYQQYLKRNFTDDFFCYPLLHVCDRTHAQRYRQCGEQHMQTRSRLLLTQQLDLGAYLKSVIRSDNFLSNEKTFFKHFVLRSLSNSKILFDF